MIDPAELIAQRSVEGNIIDRVKRLEARVALLDRSSVVVPVLSDLTNDMGNIEIGEIAGFIVSTPTLTGDDIVLDSTGIITIGSGDDVVILSAVDSVYRMWVGNATSSDAGLRVKLDGTILMDKPYATLDNYHFGEPVVSLIADSQSTSNPDPILKPLAGGTSTFTYPDDYISQCVWDRPSTPSGYRWLCYVVDFPTTSITDLTLRFSCVENRPDGNNNNFYLYDKLFTGQATNLTRTATDPLYKYYDFRFYNGGAAFSFNGFGIAIRGKDGDLTSDAGTYTLKVTILSINGNYVNDRIQDISHEPYWISQSVSDEIVREAAVETLSNKTLAASTYNSFGSKTTPIDADSVTIVDSADSSLFKKVTWANIKATLKSYFDALYAFFQIDVNRYGFVNLTDTSIGFDGTNTFTLSGTTWSYYRTGVKHTISGNKTVTLSGSPPAASGMYYIYIDDANGTLVASTSGWTLLDTKVPVAVILWNNTSTPKYWLENERHTVLIDRRYHYIEHFTEGTKFRSGGSLSGYTVTPASPTDDKNTFSISETIIIDEDLVTTLLELPDPNGTSTDYVKLLRTGASTYNWFSSAVPFDFTTSGYINYDLNGTMTEGRQERFYNSYIAFTNIDGAARFLVISGRGEFANLSSAQAEKIENFTFTGIPLTEWVVGWQLTWETKADWTTKGKARLAANPVRVNISGTKMSVAVSGVVTENQLQFTDVTTANVTGFQHGLMPKDGWIGLDTLTYGSTDHDNYTVTISGDYSLIITPGMKLKLTQTTTRYFFIVKVEYSAPNTTLTLYGGTDYILDNAVITNPYYSMMKVPVGFNLDPELWDYVYTDDTWWDMDNPVTATSYVSGAHFYPPIGIWDVMWELGFGGTVSVGSGLIVGSIRDYASGVPIDFSEYAWAVNGDGEGKNLVRYETVSITEVRETVSLVWVWDGADPFDYAWMEWRYAKFRLIYL